VGDGSESGAGGELADRGTRLGAVTIDWVIGLLITLPFVIAYWSLITSAFASGGGYGGARALRDSNLTLSGGAWGGLVVTFIAWIVWLVITIRFVSANGQTIGKRIVGIKVVRRDGSKASLGRIFWLRNVVNGIPGAIPFFGYIYQLVDGLFIFSGSRQCLHDKIADTIVVRA
jgi:uncharacterized RDD family membrane protein YckC